MKSIEVLLLGALLSALAPAAGVAAELTPEIQKHVDRARDAAGSEYGVILPGLCPGQGPPATSTEDPAVRATWYRPPAKVFDNLYYLGQTSVAAWAITTSEGIILVDALFPYSVEAEVTDGLKSLGLDPATIRYVIVTHGHLDHLGGAKYLQDHGARIVMSAADWRLAFATKGFGGGMQGDPPARDIAVEHDQTLTLGDTTVQMLLTPGHSPGTMSLIFPVKDGKRTHVAGLWGGTGLGPRQDIAAFSQYEASANAFIAATRRARVDVPLSNHPIVVDTFRKIEKLATRQPGERHPFVMGGRSQRNLLTLAAECAAAQRLFRQQ